MIIMHNLDMKIYTKDHVYTGSKWVITNNLYLIPSQNHIRLANTKCPFAPIGKILQILAGTKFFLPFEVRTTFGLF